MTADDRLTRSLVELASRGARPPCGDWRERHLWTSELAEDRAAAVELCAGCPVLLPCGDAAEAAGERWHVWAGVDRTPPTKRKPAMTPMTITTARATHPRKNPTQGAQP